MSNLAEIVKLSTPPTERVTFESINDWKSFEYYRIFQNCISVEDRIA